MKNSEKGQFEDAWLKAFENAEQSPSEMVWAGVEQGLNRSETLMLKKRVVFYQRLAAASILVALMLGGLSTYYITTLSQQENLSFMNKNIIDDKEDKKSSVSGADNADNRFPNRNESTDLSLNASPHEVKSNNDRNTHLISLDDQEANNNDESITSIRQLKVLEINNDHPSMINMIPEPNVKINGKLKAITLIRKLPAMPADLMTTKKNKEAKESLWASLGASTGNYSPSADFTAGSSVRSAAQNTGGFSGSQSAFSTTASRGTAFSIGMNLGKRISKRWLLLGGITYLNQALGYTSNYAVVDANNNVLASVADYTSSKSFSSVVAVSSPYEVTSVNEYITVPLQAGYLLVDRKIGLQLNSGISTDFFMQNTLTDKSGQMASFSSSAGSDTPYRTVSWAGLVGTELSYKIATQYRVSIAPGLRYSLNSVLKSDAVSANPLVWDVGFRFRYIIK
jgi:hypothetical protein